MDEKRFKMEYVTPKCYHIITDEGKHLDEFEILDILNKQDQDIQKYRDAFYKAHEIQQDFIKQIQQIKSIMDNELKNAFNNRINHDDYNKDPELAEYFKGYHCGVSDLIKKIMEVLH